jgi:hypothetical protein
MSEDKWVSLGAVDESYIGGKQAVLEETKDLPNKKEVLQDNGSLEAEELEVRKDFLDKIISKRNLQKKPEKSDTEFLKRQSLTNESGFGIE